MASPIHIAAMGRRRICPKCGHRQVVALVLHHEAVSCRRCGSRIPPTPSSPSASPPAPRKPRK
jgi:uncharacterized paraquat-inducible protein A